MKTTKFTFFKNTPLIDFQNTILFDDNTMRDTHFFYQGGHYDTLETEDERFNYIRDKSTVTVNIPYKDFKGVNYCSFLSDYEPDTRFYAYVIKYEMVGRGDLTKVYLLIDGIMTYCQGNVLNYLTNLTIDRQHLPTSRYNEELENLKNNDDIIKTYTKKYFATDKIVFDQFMMVIQATCDLTANFGEDENSPRIETSSGQEFDNITSPVNLYLVNRFSFERFMKSLAPYPWITQNFRSILMIPKRLINDDSYDLLPPIQGGFDQLYTFKYRANSQEEPINDIKYSMNQLFDLYGMSPIHDKHLLRNEYTTMEVYSWDGQQLFIDIGQLNPEIGLEFKYESVIGYFNQIAFFPKGYKSSQNPPENVDGSYLNDAIILKNFDEIPILVDNYGLSLAKSANQRELAESKLLTNRVKDIFAPGTELKDRFMNAASIATNFNPTDLFGKFTDEYEFYRTQKAEQADLAMSTPTITSQTNGNAFQIKNGNFGLTVKYSRINSREFIKVKKYYNMFGFSVPEENTKLQSIRSMTIANYVKFKGSWKIPNVDVAILEQMKAQFENGVRFWHNDFTPDPMSKDIFFNERRF